MVSPGQDPAPDLVQALGREGQFDAGDGKLTDVVVAGVHAEDVPLALQVGQVSGVACRIPFVKIRAIRGPTRPEEWLDKRHMREEIKGARKIRKDVRTHYMFGESSCSEPLQAM